MMSPLHPEYLDDLRKVAKGLGYNLVKRDDCVEVTARAVASNEMQTMMRSPDEISSYVRSTLVRRLAGEIVSNLEPELLPRDGDADVYELRVTLLKPGKRLLPSP